MDESLEPLERGTLLWDLWDKLEDYLHRRIDVVSEKNLRNRYFIEELNETKQLLYGKAS